ncbi:MAG: glycosyltransferase [Winogradskyella sp.]|uniref:glycosyltransferase family 2 protein n=1 Tax=Winogradskyella sp. TaxID=1883156 RepID=UPI0025FFC899|nr:glycosyltransferase family 2 protein [Winogradskyella sp.]NRB58914.1 glycosyltransferase [Winogradskyella sp.]
MSQVLVSIVIPFKNTELYIEECIVSLINQTHKDWEAVFVDDNSTDPSLNIVKKYSKVDNRIKLLRNTGNGIIKALKTAYCHCSGNYITRMDSDDIMSPNRLEVMISSLQFYGKNHLAVGQVKYFREDGLSEGFAKYERWLNQLTKTGSNFSEIYKECVIPSPCWMLHREDFEACDGFEPNRYPEDYDLAFRFYKANYKCIPCDEILLHWRDYSNRTSRTHEHYAANTFLDLKLDYFLELEFDNHRPLVIWGAGKKGKSIAKLLLEKQIEFHWICDNDKKIGKDIYNQKLHGFKYLKELKNPQCIVTVANEIEQAEISKYLKELNMKSMQDYFFFC